MKIVGVVLLVLGIMMGVGGNLPAFIDPPSMIIIITFVLGVLLMSGTRIGSMVASLFTTSSGGPEELALAAQGWALARQASVAAGAVGTLVGAVIMLKNVDDFAAIGPGIAIGLLTLLYGLVIGYGFCLPCQKHVEARASQ